MTKNLMSLLAVLVVAILAAGVQGAVYVPATDTYLGKNADYVFTFEEYNITGRVVRLRFSESEQCTVLPIDPPQDDVPLIALYLWSDVLASLCYYSNYVDIQVATYEGVKLVVGVDDTSDDDFSDRWHRDDNLLGPGKPLYTSARGAVGTKVLEAAEDGHLVQFTHSPSVWQELFVSPKYAAFIWVMFVLAFLWSAFALYMLSRMLLRRFRLNMRGFVLLAIVSVGIARMAFSLTYGIHTPQGRTVPAIWDLYFIHVTMALCFTTFSLLLIAWLGVISWSNISRHGKLWRAARIAAIVSIVITCSFTVIYIGLSAHYGSYVAYGRVAMVLVDLICFIVQSALLITCLRFFFKHLGTFRNQQKSAALRRITAATGGALGAMCLLMIVLVIHTTVNLTSNVNLYFAGLILIDIAYLCAVVSMLYTLFTYHDSPTHLSSTGPTNSNSNQLSSGRGQKIDTEDNLSQSKMEAGMMDTDAIIRDLNSASDY